MQHLIYAAVVTILWIFFTALTVSTELYRRPHHRPKLATYVFLAGFIATLVSWLAVLLFTFGVS